MKLAMVKLPKALEQENCKARLLLQVHDELVLEVAKEELKAAASLVRKVMEEAFILSIPLETEARCGTNWGNLEVIRD
jgi:DNA polymerase-1